MPSTPVSSIVLSWARSTGSGGRTSKRGVSGSNGYSPNMGESLPVERNLTAARTRPPTRLISYAFRDVGRRVMPGVSLPSSMISTESAFEQILEAIESPLTQGGFSKVEEKSHPEDFGSRHTTFGDGEEFIRLTWDGKGGWFVLESIPASSVTFESGWADILLQSFRPRLDGAGVVAEIAQDMRAALCDYLGIAG